MDRATSTAIVGERHDTPDKSLVSDEPAASLRTPIFGQEMASSRATNHRRTKGHSIARNGRTLAQLVALKGAAGNELFDPPRQAITSPEPNRTGVRISSI